jgi:putative hydrolase of the HAD superfamily
MTIRAIIFDLDDTLYPERGYAFSGFDAVARAFAPRLQAPFDLARRMRELFDTPQRGRVFDVIAQEAGRADAAQLVPEMINVYRRHHPQITLYSDAAAALDRCRDRYRLGLLSDGHLVAQEAKIDALSIRDRFDAIILTDRWGREFWKPHPRGYQEMTRRLNVPATQCAYVSDNPAKDFIAPNQLGWLTVRVRRSDGVYIGEQPPAGGEPAHTIPTLDELDAVLKMKKPSGRE